MATNNESEDASDETYECEKCGGALSRENVGEHFRCEGCNVSVAPEILRRTGNRI